MRITRNSYISKRYLFDWQLQLAVRQLHNSHLKSHKTRQCNLSLDRAGQFWLHFEVEVLNILDPTSERIHKSMLDLEYLSDRSQLIASNINTRLFHTCRS